jgi:hypothetical protein
MIWDVSLNHVFQCSRKFCFAGDPACNRFILNAIPADNLTSLCIAQRRRCHPLRGIFSVLSCESYLPILFFTVNAMF